MKVKVWLEQSTKSLNEAGIGTARLDCLVLIGDALQLSRIKVLASPELEIDETQLKILTQQLNQRLKHIPLAFIRGKTEFYGREFLINKDVLEPRPESETMIELLKTILDHKNPSSRVAPWNIVDVGTGSGALGITAKLEFPDISVSAIDIDPKCLRVARENAKKHRAVISFYKGDLLQPLSTSNLENLAVLANLPYVPDDYEINQAAMNEPRIAIFGGADGLDLYRKLFDQLKQVSSVYLLTESLPFQHSALKDLASSHGFRLKQDEDFLQLFTKHE